MAKDPKPRKVKTKTYTRAQAIAAMNAGADPLQFANHQNYHTRIASWVASGKQIPEGKEAQEELLLSFQGRKRSDLKDAELQPLLDRLRAKHFEPKAPLPKAELILMDPPYPTDHKAEENPIDGPIPGVKEE
jgi:hypothetical protein